jgi:hypothetical protein
MNELHQSLISLIFKATRFIKFEDKIGKILVKESQKLKVPFDDLLLNQQLINLIILNIFSNLGEAINALNLQYLMNFLNSIFRLYQTSNDNKNFRTFLKKNKKTELFDSYERKLNFLIIFGKFYKKLEKYFSGEQVKLLFMLLWNCDDLGVIFYQNLEELKMENKSKLKFLNSSEEVKKYKVSKNLIDLIIDVKRKSNRIDMLKLFNESKQGSDHDQKDNKIQSSLSDELTKLKRNSQSFESIAERLILLTILTQNVEDPNFQEFLHLLYKLFIKTILKDKLVLTSDGNFSSNKKRNVENNDNSNRSHTISIFGILIGLSRNLLRMINFIIVEVKKNKTQYRKILSYLHALSHHNLITILIDKLTQNKIDELAKDKGSNTLLYYIRNDQIKKSELEIIKTYDESLSKGKIIFIESKLILFRN